MRMNKVLSIGFAVLLLLSMVMVAGAVTKHEPPAGQAVMWVDPSYVNGSQVGLGNTFVVEVWINVSDTAGPVGDRGMYAFDYRLKWNNTLITCTLANIVRRDPTDVDPWFWSGGEPQTLADVVEDYAGKKAHHFAKSAVGVGGGFNGSMWLARYTFTVAYQPVVPEPSMSCALDIQFVSPNTSPLMDTNGDPITTTITDGTYEIFVQPPPTPMLEVKDPRDHDNDIERCDFKLGSKFNVTICIKMLHWAKYFRAWEAKLEFDTTLLNASKGYNGTFMELFGSVFYINFTVYEDLGYILMAATYLGEPTPEPGTTPPCSPGYGPAQGVLAYVEFLVTNISLAPKMYECEIGLFDTILVDKDDLEIEHGIQANLTYYACWTSMGWFLDCTTDSFRKKCETPFIGAGINETADSFEPQDLVILYAYLEFNQEPEAYKLVAFEIHGPPNPYYNITIYRTAWTNASGVATINFTIPGSGFPNWREMVFGHWSCYQAAQVKTDPATGVDKPTDWLYFKVGWIIEITDVTVIVPHPEGVEKGETITIVIDYKTIMFIPKDVLFTVTVLDELLDPIQWDKWWVLQVAPTEPVLCSFREDVTFVLSEIPPWAHIGLATVYVNAFTDLPSNCGCLYCPEVTETFWVIKTGSGT